MLISVNCDNYSTNCHQLQAGDGKKKKKTRIWGQQRTGTSNGVAKFALHRLRHYLEPDECAMTCAIHPDESITNKKKKLQPVYG